MILSIITAMSLQYGVPTNVMRAIHCVETSCGKNVRKRINSNGTLDVGPFQINSIHRRGKCNDLNIDTDLGNVECAARLLAMHKNKAKSDPMWFARYHSKTKKYKLRYYKKVLKYL